MSKFDFKAHVEQVANLLPDVNQVLLWFGSGQIRQFDRLGDGWNMAMKTGSLPEPRFRGVVIRLGRTMPLLCVEAPGSTCATLRRFLVAEACLSAAEVLDADLPEGTQVGVDLHSAMLKGTALLPLITPFQPILRAAPPALLTEVGCEGLIKPAIPDTVRVKMWYGAPWPMVCEEKKPRAGAKEEGGEKDSLEDA